MSGEDVVAEKGQDVWEDSKRKRCTIFILLKDSRRHWLNEEEFLMEESIQRHKHSLNEDVVGLKLELEKVWGSDHK